MLRLGGVPELYWQSEWEKVRDPGVKEWSLTLAARTHQQDEPGTVNWALLGRGLMLVGPVGTGKSSAAALCCMEAARIRRTVKWAYVPELMDSLANAKERPAIMRKLARDDVLVLDDFGVRSIADWEVEHLDALVEARYQRRKLMIVTGNVIPSELAADERLARITDRWRDRTARDLVVLGGRSMRGA